MTEEEILNYDMKFEKSSVEIVTRIHRPYIIIKDRPYLGKDLEIDLGEIVITQEEES